MVEVPTRTLRSYFANLTGNGQAGLVDQNLDIRNDLVTTAQGLPSGGATGQALVKTSGTNFAVAWSALGAGDMIKATYDPTNINASAFARANHTGTQPVSTITGLATVATSGSYADLSNKPTTLAPRASTVASTATLTPNADAVDLAAVTAQAASLTIAAPTGTPLNGQELTIRVRDNGTTRTLTWNAVYSSSPSVLPTATLVGSTMIYRFVFNASNNQWDLLMGNPIGGLWG